MAWNSANFCPDLESALSSVPGLYAELSDSPASTPSSTEAEAIANRVAGMMRIVLAHCGYDLSSLTVTSGSDADYALQHIEQELVGGHVWEAQSLRGMGNNEAAREKIRTAWGDGIATSDAFRASLLGQFCGMDRDEASNAGVTDGGKADPAETLASWTRAALKSTDTTRTKHTRPGTDALNLSASKYL